MSLLFSGLRSSFKHSLKGSNPFTGLNVTRPITTVIDPISELPVLPPRKTGAKPTQDSDVDSIYKEPLRVESKHQNLSCNLHLRSYIPPTMDFYCDFIRRAAFEMGVPCGGVVHLRTRTERWAVPKSPFIHKKRQEIFERKTHKRLLQLKDASPQTLEKLLAYISENLPPGVGARADRYCFEDANQIVEQLESGLKVKLSDPTPKPKILADAIIEEMKKNPNANLHEVGLRLHKEIFNVELPVLDFVCKPKKKKEEAPKVEAKVAPKGKGKKK